MGLKQLSTIAKVKFLLLCLFIGIVTMKEFSYHVVPGLDETYRWALNYFLGNDKAILSYITYSYGPLTLLKWPIPLGDHVLIASIFNILLNGFFVFSLANFYCTYNKTQEYIKPVLLALVYLLAVNIDYILIGAIAINLAFVHYEKKRYALYSALLLTVLGIYIKTAIMVLILAIWLVFILGLLIKKRFKEVLLSMGAGLCMYFIIGAVVFHSMPAAWNYGVVNLSMAMSYSDVLNLYPDNNIRYLLVSILSLISVFLIYRKQPAGYMITLLSLCLFANWKYAMSYEGYWHAVSFIYMVLLALVMTLVLQKKQLGLLLVLFLLSISTYAHNLQNVVHYRNNLIWIPDLSIFKQWVLHHNETKEKVWEESKSACAPSLLPQEVLNEIGDATVDILPYDLSIAMINKLNYKPRPTLQTGLFGVALDKKDAAFIASNEAAEYLIWHSHGAGKTSLDGLDDNYLPNTNPYSFEAFWQYYSPNHIHNDRYTVWERRGKPLQQTINEQKIQNLRWEEWVIVPVQDSNERIRVKVDVPFTMKYKLRSAVYKGLPVFIEMETETGRVVKYRFSPSKAEAGLLASPLFTDHDMSSEKVKRIRFVNQRPGEGYYQDELSIQWLKLSYKE